MKTFVKDFKSFAMRGNVVDLAIGVIIGGAFGSIVSSLVKDIIMPPLGVVLGGIDFSNLTIVLQKATEGSEAITMNIGLFLQSVIDFLIIAFAIFFVVRVLAKLQKKEEAKPTTPPKQELLLTEIRDLLKK